MPHRVLMVFSILIISTSAANAVDFHLDLYGGIAQTKTGYVHATLPLLGQAESRRINYDDEFTGGLRFKMWPARLPWLGYGQDFSRFEAKTDGVDFAVYAVTPMLMMQIPVARTEEFPTGRFNPYAGFGPSFAYIDATVDFRPGISAKISHGELTTGYQAVVGLHVFLERQIGLFGEYRYTRYTPDIEDDKCDIFFGCTTTERVKATLETNHFVVGVSFKF